MPHGDQCTFKKIIIYIFKMALNNLITNNSTIMGSLTTKFYLEKYHKCEDFLYTTNNYISKEEKQCKFYNNSAKLSATQPILFKKLIFDKLSNTEINNIKIVSNSQILFIMPYDLIKFAFSNNIIIENEKMIVDLSFIHKIFLTEFLFLLTPHHLNNLEIIIDGLNINNCEIIYDSYFLSENKQNIISYLDHPINLIDTFYFNIDKVTDIEIINNISGGFIEGLPLEDVDEITFIINDCKYNFVLDNLHAQLVCTKYDNGFYFSLSNTMDNFIPKNFVNGINATTKLRIRVNKPILYQCKLYTIDINMFRTRYSSIAFTHEYNFKYASIKNVEYQPKKWKIKKLKKINSISI
jgi:hypothetical protein